MSPYLNGDIREISLIRTRVFKIMWARFKAKKAQRQTHRLNQA